MKKCMDYEAWIPEYLDGELTEAEAAEFEAHIESCSSCQKALEEARLLFADIASAAEDTPPELKERVMNSVRLEARSKKSRVGMLVRSLGGVAACLVVVVGIISIFPHLNNKAELEQDADRVAEEPEFSIVTSTTAPEETVLENIRVDPTGEAADEEIFSESAGSLDDADDTASSGNTDMLTDGMTVQGTPESSEDKESSVTLFGDIDGAEEELEDVSETYNEYSESLQDEENEDPAVLFMTKGAVGLAEYLKSLQ